MIQVKKEGVLLAKSLIPFEDEGVLNPAAIRDGNFVHMFYRAVSRGNHSSIGYCKLDGPLSVVDRHKKSLLAPEFDYECQGMEDPRIVKIEDTYYLTYTAYDGVNALGCLAVSKDLIHFEKKGIIVPQISYAAFDQLAEQSSPINKKYFRYNEHIGVLESDLEKSLIWDKNVIFFPRKIKGKFHFMHRIKPDIQIVVGVDNLKDLTEAFYQDYLSNFNDHVLLSSKHDHEISYVGGGCPPIETDQGWLIIYHGVKDGLYGYIYSACAALLDLEDPRKEIARLPYPLFKPELDWELKGEVNNVCFPTGAVVFDDTLYIYYGAADERIATTSVSVSALIKELLLYNKQDDK
ncbi:pesticidal protein Cry7Aa [Flavobacterium sp. SOK18b]|uniref:glycoside hydrolase family 130 protein n=1 Tax=Flavobacterium sp. SOK18b TaxID=797900 RepID=UPI0015F7FF00|nr:pesticidal protein Cry7Aa [Flavobacterium sp. SOK18b]MBB1193939.1 pesticidal protein Cry7Aa [Flavobacterium sp. SOK18b]